MAEIEYVEIYGVMTGCPLCGAAVFDEELHTLAHEKNEVVTDPPPPAPVEVPRPPSPPQFPALPPRAVGPRP